MPFDPIPTTEQKIATKDQFWAATPRQQLEMLVYALEHLPTTHEWCFQKYGYYDECGSSGCAIGLAEALWGATFFTFEQHDWRLHNLFYANGAGSYQHTYECEAEKVTPQMVANAIHTYLETGYCG